MIYTLVIILIIIIIAYIYAYSLGKFGTSGTFETFEHIKSDIIFLNESDLKNILKNNNDKYYNTFYKNDYFSRKIKDIREYHEKIDKSTTEFDTHHKKKIITSTKIIDNILNNIKLDYFDGRKANNIQWKIGCVSGKLYENGLPHTRDDIIIISKQDVQMFSDTKLTKTLLHEKIHLYQKVYPNDIDIYINKNNFTKYKKRTHADNIRANPDLDNWIYKDKDQNILKAVYNENPSSIEDINYSPFNSQSFEHPYEKMAIELEEFV